MSARYAEQTQNPVSGRRTLRFSVWSRSGECYNATGWRTVEAESVFEAAHRFHRLPLWMRPLAWLPRSDLRHPGSKPTIAVALLSH
jgi:hypothetical protein